MSIKEIIQQQGWLHLRGLTEVKAREIALELGHVLLETQVKPSPESRSLVTSNRPLGPHTDHHAAQYILWYCEAQSLTGGETLLIDAWKVIETMPKAFVDQLYKTQLKEHAVFDGDLDFHNMLEDRVEGKWNVYYSFWLANKEENVAFQAFTRALTTAPQVEFRLAPGDVLIVDNRRMLHCRKAIPVADTRHLIRLWIS